MFENDDHNFVASGELDAPVAHRFEPIKSRHFVCVQVLQGASSDMDNSGLPDDEYDDEFPSYTDGNTAVTMDNAIKIVNRFVVGLRIIHTESLCLFFVKQIHVFFIINNKKSPILT